MFGQRDLFVRCAKKSPPLALAAFKGDTDGFLYNWFHGVTHMVVSETPTKMSQKHPVYHGIHHILYTVYYTKCNIFPATPRPLTHGHSTARTDRRFGTFGDDLILGDARAARAAAAEVLQRHVGDAGGGHQQGRRGQLVKDVVLFEGFGLVSRLEDELSGVLNYVLSLKALAKLDVRWHES